MRHNTEPDLPGGYWQTAPEPPEGEFHVGLVMAGAVSAGAYTAGVMDFLIEALDAWEAEKAKERASSPDPATWSIPGHDIRLRIMTGASAGSIVAAITAAALNYRFPHVPGNTPYAQNIASEWVSNPLYKAWVKDIDIRALLGHRDLDRGRDALVRSVLDTSILDDIARSAIGYRGSVAPLRPYLASPLRLVFTLGNLRGTPYFLEFEGSRGAGLGMVSHSDYVRYCIHYGSGAYSSPYADEQLLPTPNDPDDPVWSAFTQAALASGAFPIGLAPRPFTRNRADYQYRYTMVPGHGGADATARPLKPRWKDETPSMSYATKVVDGGTMNNDPLELARVELAGYIGSNPRSGTIANRAVVMIDPFPDQAVQVDDERRGQADDLLGAGMGLLMAWKDQARFKPLDIALAEDSRIYSRYIIAPSRDETQNSNGRDIACGALGGFSGFFLEEYRHHDYMLGRRNCQWFLRKYFVLPVGNTTAFKIVNPALKKAGSPWAVQGDEGLCLPIIPLMGRLNSEEEALPQWPQGTLNLDEFRDPIGDRLKRVMARLLETTIHPNFLQEFAAEAGLAAIRGRIVDKILGIISAGLADRNLKTHYTPVHDDQFLP